MLPTEPLAPQPGRASLTFAGEHGGGFKPYLGVGAVTLFGNAHTVGGCLRLCDTVAWTRRWAL